MRSSLLWLISFFSVVSGQLALAASLCQEAHQPRLFLNVELAA